MADAMAAPATPSAGKPHRPKIRRALKTTLVATEQAAPIKGMETFCVLCKSVPPALESAWNG